MRNYYLLLLLVVAAPALAQNEAIFSQFFYNKLYSNPGAAAADGWATLSAFHRRQWDGLQGAPQTSSLLFQTPAFGKRVGLGLTLLNERIGFFNNSWANVSYAYRMPVAKGVLSIGIQGTYALYHTDWAQARTSSQNPDPITLADPYVSSFNVGAGFHFQADNFFFGASVPYFLQRNITGLDDEGISGTNGADPQLFLTAGGVFTLSQWVKMRPAFQLRLVGGAPINTDAHLSFGLLRDARLWIGTTYRWSFSSLPSMGDAVAVQAQLQLSERLRFGAAYDIFLGNLQFEYGRTYEVMLEYVFLPPANGVRNPRYF